MRPSSGRSERRTVADAVESSPATERNFIIDRLDLVLENEELEVVGSGSKCECLVACIVAARIT